MNIGGDVQVDEDERVTDAVVAVGGSIDVRGRVEDDVVAVLGNVRLGPHAVVTGSVTSVGGRIEQERGAEVHGEVNEVTLNHKPWRYGHGPWRLWVSRDIFSGLVQPPRHAPADRPGGAPGADRRDRRLGSRRPHLTTGGRRTVVERIRRPACPGALRTGARADHRFPGDLDRRDSAAGARAIRARRAAVRRADGIHRRGTPRRRMGGRPVQGIPGGDGGRRGGDHRGRCRDPDRVAHPRPHRTARDRALVGCTVPQLRRLDGRPGRAAPDALWHARSVIAPARPRPTTVPAPLPLEPVLDLG